MAHPDQILKFLASIAPKSASNAEIRAGTGIGLHQTVFQCTRLLLDQKKVQGRQFGKEWLFWVGDADTEPKPPIAEPQLTRDLATKVAVAAAISPAAFEALARSKMGAHFGVDLMARQVPGVPKLFDLVSSDYAIVGDAKYYTLVLGERLPPAKFSVIAEHVWLLEKTGARHKFLVFGNDRRVPEQWLRRYRGIVSGVRFFFISADQQVEELSAITTAEARG